jgi:hypothetical protein
MVASAMCTARGRTPHAILPKPAQCKQGGPKGKARGLIPRCAEALFQGVNDIKRASQATLAVYISCLEMYLDHIRDIGRVAAAMQGPGAKRA